MTIPSSSFALFVHTPTEMEYALIGAVTDSESVDAEDSTKLSGVLLVPVRGARVINHLPIYVPYEVFMSSVGDNGLILQRPLYRYEGKFYVDYMENMRVRGFIAHLHTKLTDQIVEAKKSTALNNANVWVSPCVVGGVYRHYKNGKLYRLAAVASDHTRDDAEVVVYYGLDDPSQLWTRDYDEFFEVVTNKEGVKIPRFTFCYIGRWESV